MKKKQLDLQVAHYIFATNTSFRSVENTEFLKLVNMLRPGYTPPNHFKIGNELLNEVYDQVSVNTKEGLAGKTVSMALDGWSNVHNESIICICVTEMTEGCVYLLETIDTLDNSYTWDYLVSMTESAILSCEKFGCIVSSVVTDNAANMSKMRRNLAMSEKLQNKQIITYGCSAHMLNLLAHDIEAPGIKSHIKTIFKYFRNSHYFGAKYRMEGGKILVMPQDVRRNTLADTIQCYLDNWHLLYKIYDENRSAVDGTIFAKIKDIETKSIAEEYLIKLKKIAMSLDKIQADCCTISEATHIWLDLKTFFEIEVCSSEMLKFFTNRFEKAISEYHYLAYILDPRYIGEKLTEEQLDSTMNYVSINHPEIMDEIITFQAQGFPFKSYLFNENIVLKIKPLTWWIALEKNLTKEMNEMVKQLFTSCASSAGIERIFSTYGIVHTKLRNRLGIEKSSKLVSVPI